MGKKDTRTVPVQVGQEVDVQVERLGYRGEGVARYEGFTLFIDGALPGEHVRVRVTQLARSFAHAHLREVLTSSEERLTPPCSVYDLCGGCQLQHLAYPAQLRWKRQAVVDALTRIGKFDAAEMESLVRPALGMDEPWRYRNKVQVAAAERGGQFVAGFVEEGTHEPVEAAECLIRPLSHDRLLAAILEVMDEYNVAPFDEATGKGDVRSVMIRTTTGGQALLAIATVGERLAHAEKLARRLGALSVSGGELTATDKIAVTGVVQVVAGSGESSLAASTANVRVLWGSPFIEETIMGLRFRVSAQSFLQVNPVQTSVLYESALQMADIQKDDVVWDLYSGIGTLSLLAAQRAAQVIGVEEVEAATVDAQYNAEVSGLDHVSFLTGKAETVLTKLHKSGPTPDVVLLDPPRVGCDPAVIAAVAAARPQRVVYISCNPATLARDLRLLADQGYALNAAQPVDMFPQTAHVECVVLMVRKLSLMNKHLQE